MTDGKRVRASLGKTKVCGAGRGGEGRDHCGSAMGRGRVRDGVRNWDRDRSWIVTSGRRHYFFT